MTAPLDLATQQELSLRYGEYTRLVAKDQHKRPGVYDDDGVRQYGLIAFVRYFWHILEPETRFVDGWPLWAMCEHLEAVTAGRIIRLLMNVPPGHMKSLLTDVFWPAWEWGPMGKAHFRYVTFSYSASLTERDNDRFRLLIASPEYQVLYGPMVTMVEDEAGNVLADVGNVVRLRNKTTIKVINSKLGFKLASSVGGVGTGERGDRIIIDDPHNVTEAESDRIRGETIKWFRESISSRFNDLDLGALVIIMQRVHQDDISGIVLGAGFDYCHLMIPWEYDPTRAVSEDGEVIENDIGWIDPRCDPDDFEANDGEPAWPERFSPKAMLRTKAETGEYGWAAQYQQSPMPRGGGLFKREWWQPWAPESGEFPLFDYVLASLDVAVTEKASNNPSGLTVWGLFPLPEDPSLTGIMLIYAFRKRLMIHGADVGPRLKHEIPTPGDNRQTVINKEMMLARRVGSKWGLVEWVAHVCKIRMVDKLLIEAEKGGIVVAQEMARLYGDEPWAVQCMPVKGDKYARALAVEPTFAQGKVWAPVKDWSEMVIEEMEVFPAGKYDDLCLAAGTMISTKRGLVPIERVRVGDLVITPYGWKGVVATHFMGIKPVGSVAGLTGTANHPIFTLDNSLTRMDSITQASQVMRFTLCDLTRVIRQTRSTSKALGIVGWEGNGAIIYRKLQAARGQRDCMLRYGNGPMALFLSAMRFTTRTATHSIAALKILSVYRVACIGACPRGLIRKSVASFWRLFDHWRLHGIARMLEWLGIVSTSRRVFASQGLSRYSRSREYEFACGVVRNTSGEQLGRFFARQSVVYNSAHIDGARTGSFTHSMQPVYDLTIEDAHCYYANGVLVHNTDSATQAIKYLRDAGLAQTEGEVRLAEFERVRHRPKQRALYPV